MYKPVIQKTVFAKETPSRCHKATVHAAMVNKPDVIAAADRLGVAIIGIEID